ncbi:MAG: hypothetical protein IJ728_13370 [Selenomonadaceae bacterium]|nr:hypothetical protein [Selenomonadaceae bacterium]
MNVFKTKSAKRVEQFKKAMQKRFGYVNHRVSIVKIYQNGYINVQVLNDDFISNDHYLLDRNGDKLHTYESRLDSYDPDFGTKEFNERQYQRKFGGVAV